MKLSFDMDGVVADIGGPFYQRFEKKYGLQPTRETFLNLMQLGKPWNGIESKDFVDFNTAYLKELHRDGFQVLNPVDGVVQGLLELKNEGFDLDINTNRPREFEGQSVDTTQSTREWLDTKGLEFVVLNVAQGSDEKVANICAGRYLSHVDDQAKILGKLYKANPGIRRGFYVQMFWDDSAPGAFTDFTRLSNWRDVVGYCLNLSEDGKP